MHCAHCHRPLAAETAWKSAAGHFYCGEFCADSETIVSKTIAVVASATRVTQLHREHSFARLERLLPYLRRPASAAQSAQR